jgi:hypothetical protein
VLIHELAHHATACSVIKKSRRNFTWNDYKDCHGGNWPSVHEYFAQALTFICISEHHKELLPAFQQKSQHQSSIYRTWEVLDAFEQNKVSLDSIRASIQAQFVTLLESRVQCLAEIEDIDAVYNVDE